MQARSQHSETSYQTNLAQSLSSAVAGRARGFLPGIEGQLK